MLRSRGNPASRLRAERGLDRRATALRRQAGCPFAQRLVLRSRGNPASRLRAERGLDRRATALRRQAACALALLPLLVVAGCAAPPVRPTVQAPPSAPAEAELVRGERFDLWREPGVLEPWAEARLVAELSRARELVGEWLGPDAASSQGPAFGPPSDGAPTPAARIPVVIVRRGSRSYTDRTSVTLVTQRLANHDATHELVHWLAGPGWRPLDEGLATWLTERLCGEERAPLEVRARVYADLSQDGKVGTDARPEAMSRRDYDVAGAFVGWLVATYGRDAVMALYRGPVRDYEGALKTSEAELWRRFWQHIRGLQVRHDGRYHSFKAWVGVR